LDRFLHSIEEINETLENVQHFLKEDRTIENIVSHFSEKQSQHKTKAEVVRLKNQITMMLGKSHQRIARIEALKKKWDAKYPKPAYCKPYKNTHKH
jgi:hypothetical protein